MSARIGLAACVFRSLEMMAVARHCGFDFLLADMEHGAMSLGEAATLSVAGREAGFPVHVRVPGIGSEMLTRVVDCGAAGLIVPHVDSLADAKFVVEKVRFPPHGTRSIPPPIAPIGFRPMPVRDLIGLSETALEVVLMIESREGVADVRAIAALEGVDGLLVGGNDLAQSLGHTGNIGHPDVLAAFREIAEATKDARKFFGVIGVPPSLVHTHALALGASYVVAANDINLLFEAGAAAAAEARALMRS
ncbi:aldolase/citrate lyase family protein [Aquamicrobium sp. LC103]|uniref:HpcH/HpaI aldolase family protein n=1 Tax=Aquamicrobium sp. LC103 TaxID=1120658 RepID=UPI00069A4DF3|nr:aldolase/citrate lyase family protein [Aquamicrobium sp. LC103]TKT74412.1 aldolase [Aquamicrobium sp. LC103]